MRKGNELKACSIFVVFAVALFAASPLLGYQKKKSTWDVTQVEGSSKKVEFETSEGTWMNLDVSPDGRTIVFDLVGDIYSMPISGGTAKLLLGGHAYEVQPRFSPDGSKISFTSDRKGGDNIWIMNADGSDLKQITNEKFRLLNNAAWTPDGQYLVARKHFTSGRSLGAGEMWMYHISGGSGLQMTKMKNSQQDAGQPTLSPDGRYLFYSEDMSGGSTFQYNKDPYGQIYVIRRLDRESGKLINYVTGAGGAIGPQVSPDGKYLSFIRRVRLKSVLYVRNMETLEEWPVYDNLTKDQQEAWAIFGPSPNYSWLPDGSAIMTWAKGAIWQIDVASRKAKKIPFTATVKQEIARALHFKNDPHPEKFEAKLLRDGTTSPDGKWLVFSAVGQLWKKALPNGKVTRVSKSTHSEYYPAFSPDAKWVVYATWDDDELGGIYKIKINGGAPAKLTREMGYYSQPSFSHDGQKIVYRRTRGNGIAGFMHGTKPGIYWVPANGGAATLITERGRDPRFNAAGDRIYFSTGGGLKKQFKSIGVDGKKERTHFNLKYATDPVPSPDGNWVAFKELHNAYIAPFAKTGKAINLNKDTKAIPVKRVTADAGNYLHWSGDSRKLHWLIGPEYFTRSLKNSFSFVEGAADSIAGPDTTGLAVTLQLESDVPSGVIAFTGARIVTMNGDEVVENGTVVVEGNKIKSIGTAAQVTVPAGAHVVDAAGKTIIPGFVDVHAHVGHFFSGVLPRRNWSYYANLAFGVTTTHDPSANNETVFTQSEMVRAGKMVGPRTFSTGTILYGADGDFKAVINSIDDARSHMRRMKAIGAFSVKSYNQPRRDQRQQVIKAARELDMLVMPEGGSTFTHNMSMILDGHTGIEHSIPIAPLYKDILTIWENSRTAYTPTFVVSYGGITGEYYWYQHTNVWEHKRLLNFVPRSMVDARSRRRLKMPENDFHHIEIAKTAKELVNRGVNVHIGSHGQLQGLAAHWEIWMMEQGGMTPLEALRGATLHGASYLGMQDFIGSLESGKLADLVVLDKNPLENIRNTDSISHVMVNGRLYDAETMHEIGNHPKKRGSFYWEKGKGGEVQILEGDDFGFAKATCSCSTNH